MINLLPLRPIQIVDVSFQLMRKKFISSLSIALLVSLPIQIVVWIFQVSLTQDGSGSDLQGRTVLVATILQFLAIGFSLSVVSNLLSSRVSKVYASSIFHDSFSLNRSTSKIAIGFYHLAIQIIFAGSLLLLRFILGQSLTDSQANTITWLTLFIVLFPWIFVTLRLGFSVPIATYEGGTFNEILKRTRRLNKVHFWKLFVVYCICLFMIAVLTIPSLSAVGIIVSNNLIKSDIGQNTLTNLIILLVVSTISLVYSYMLTVTYFNARIEHEGFDISVSINEQALKGGSRGKLLNDVAR